MTLQDLITYDLTVFISEDYGTIHNIDGKDIQIVVDDEGLAKAQYGSRLAVVDSKIMFRARTKDLGKRKLVGQTLLFDGKVYNIDSWDEDVGISTIYLSVPETN